MSTPPSVSGNTALGSKVTPSQVPVASQDDIHKHAALPSPPPRPGSIISSGLGPGKRLSGLPSDRLSKSFFKGDQSPLLSERESIFATHYLPSDNNNNDINNNNNAGTTFEPTLLTPGRSDAAGAEHDVNITMESPISTIPPFPPTSLFTAKSNSTSTLTPPTRSLAVESPKTDTVGGNVLLKRDSGFFGAAAFGMRRVASEDKRLQAALSSTLQSVPPVKRAITISMSSHPKSTEKAATDPAVRGSVRQDRTMEPKDGQKPTLPARSASRGRNHVEKRIEATVPNDEPPTNVRSRKSSHYLKLFNANTSSLELRKPDEQRRERPSADGDSAKLDSSQESPSLQKRHSWSLATSPDDRLRRRGSSLRGVSTENIYSESAQKQKASTSSEIKHETASRSESYESLTEIPKKDALLIPDIQKLRALPLQVLQEIRDHNLTPGPGRGSSFSRSIPVTVAERSLIGRQEPAPPEDESSRDSQLQPPSEKQGLKDEDEEEDEEHNKEHISSAVYFPHAGLSPEEVEHFKPIAKTIANDSRLSEDAVSPSTSIPDEGLPGDHDGQTDHVDISLQSMGEKFNLHGDLESTKVQRSEVSDKGLAAISELGPSSASESEAESGDEAARSAYDEYSGLTDDAETTPTATPTPGSQLKHRRESVTVSSLSLNGSVQLKPYKDQVGGHSQVFGFSHQAVCKQLNNRENEFYERIERRHPEMLKFLPRYIGVLNVTFTKGKRHKDKLEHPKDSDSTPDLTSAMDGASAANPEFTEPSEITARADEPRIVSHQQQTGELAKVVLENNRHIFPPDLFGPPPRPRSADPTQSQIRHGSAPRHRPSMLSGYASTPSDKMSSIRPPLTSSPGSWGATTVNTKLREQVLREVFGPPVVHQHRRRNHSRNTLPRLRQQSERRQTNFSDSATFDARRSMGDLSRMVAGATGTEATEDTQTRQRSEVGISVQAQPTPDQDSSALIVEVDEHVLEKMRTVEDTELKRTMSNSHPIKRRHSGSGLRRRRSTVNGVSPGDLEFFDEGHQVIDEHDIFRMDSPGSELSKPPLGPSTDTTGNAVIPSDGGDSNEKPPVATADSEAVELTKPTPINGQELIRTPINPKEAQLNQLNPDERVQFFLLLENLTAGINKPCVLDLKMGTRQYGIEANEKKKRSQRRKCKTTTSSQLGVRLCGMQVWNVKKQKYFFEDKYQGRDLKAGREFQDALTRFLYDGVSNSSVLKHIPIVLEKIAKLDNMIRRLPGYRFYASSLLLIYDGEPNETPDDKGATTENDKEGSNGPKKKEDRQRKAKSTIDVKIVDFANCVTGEDKLSHDIPCPPHDLHAVDRGYLRGLRTLRMYFQRIMNEINSLNYVERGEGEGMAMGQSGAGTGTALGEWSDNIMDDDVGEVSL